LDYFRKNFGWNSGYGKRKYWTENSFITFYFGGYELIKDYEKGKIKEGYFADLTILDRDYFSVNEEEIKDITSKLTIVDGKVVYGDQTYKHVAPASLPVLPEWSPVKYYGGYQTK
jgi:hypothetical protein